MTAIDTHAHIDHIENWQQALDEAAAAGVEAVMAVTVDWASMQKTLEIQKGVRRPRIYVALGIHPGNIKAEEVEETLQFLRAHIREAAAVGEIGLDFWYKWVRKDDAKKEEQRRVFRRQLEIAQEFELPVIVHARGTWRESFETVRSVGLAKALFHWYSGPLDVLDDIIKEGYLVSASPSLAYSPPSREAIARAPIDQTLIETDSPVFYRTGEGEGGFEAGPKDVFKTLAAYVQLKNLGEDKALEIFNRNARRFFSLEEKSTAGSS